MERERKDGGGSGLGVLHTVGDWMDNEAVGSWVDVYGGRRTTSD